MSQRVYLRPPERTDIDELKKRYRESRMLFSGVASWRFERAAFEKKLSNLTESNKPFLICLAGDDLIVGQLELSQIVYGDFQSAYLGYKLFSGFTGRGYMTEAVNAVVRYAFRELRLHRLEANVQPDNAASINVLRRCGFKQEGFSPRYLKIACRWRDHERWAILKEDWKRIKVSVSI